jgi:hypothetical protein
MTDEKELVNSPLQQDYQSKGHTLEIQIYKFVDDAEWVLEVVDAGGTSTVWDDKFATDAEALAEALRSIEKDGVESFLTGASPEKLH